MTDLLGGLAATAALRFLNPKTNKSLPISNGKSACQKCGMRRAHGVLFGVFGVCLGPKLVLYMRKG